jgi:hypothetical protein
MQVLSERNALGHIPEAPGAAPAINADRHRLIQISLVGLTHQMVARPCVGRRSCVRGGGHGGSLLWSSCVPSRVPVESGRSMSRDFERSASQAVKSGSSRRGKSRRDSPLLAFIRPQLSQPVEKPPSGPHWLHEIKLDGYRMAARIDNGRVQLLTRTGLDWTDKYPSAIAALANLNIKTAYLDGELCGVDEVGLPTFAHIQAGAGLRFGRKRSPLGLGNGP